METICYLSKMPLDIQNHIAHFLLCDDETEEQFIARTKKPSRIIATEDWKKLCSHFPDTGKTIKSLILGSSPDNNKIVLLQEYYTAPYNNQEDKKPSSDLIMFDIREGIEKSKKIYTGEISKKDCWHIALSQSANMIASIHKGSSITSRPCKDSLSVQKLDAQKTLSFIIPYDFFIGAALVNFNKQGTHVIVHGHVDLGHGRTKQHLIFPLKKQTHADIEYTEKPTNLLQNYFRETRVCNKSIASSEK
jgi:hypothetical protein